LYFLMVSWPWSSSSRALDRLLVHQALCPRRGELLLELRDRRLQLAHDVVAELAGLHDGVVDVAVAAADEVEELGSKRRMSDTGTSSRWPLVPAQMEATWRSTGNGEYCAA
jgi:hypothetical protein